MTHNNSPFRVILCFVALVIASLQILPGLEVDLMPKDKSHTLTVFYSLPNSNPDLVEQQLTSVIEGACSQLTQLKKISSISNYNNGSVRLHFDKSADMIYKQLELSTLIRQLYPHLPPSASYPLIIRSANNKREQSPLLIYSVNANLQPFQIKQEAEDAFLKAFAGMTSVKEVKISGVENLQVTVRFDKDKCNAWQIEPGRIMESIQAYFIPSYPGDFTSKDGERFFLHIPSQVASIATMENILLPVTNNNSLRLKDLASIFIEEQEPQGYFRINGKNFVSISVYPKAGQNVITLGKRIKEIVSQVQNNMPDNFDIQLVYDDAEFLEKEITKSYKRGVLAICILILCISISYRNWRYLINLLTSLLVSLSLTIILVWLFKIDIHLYTIAGFAISFGIMMDNSIIMMDYYHQRHSRKVVITLLGATLTTISAFWLIFLLPEEETTNFRDFSAVIVLSLISSLITSLWYTPGLHLLLNTRLTDPHQQIARNGEGLEKSLLSKRQSREKLRLNLLSVYYNTISFIAKYRKSFVTILLLCFGLPTFLLPAKLEGFNWYSQWYNLSLGSENFQDKIKPTADKLLGGALRLFVNNVYEKGGYRTNEKTKLYINAELPFGNTIEQLNSILSDYERYLSKVKGIDKYITNIHSGQNGSIEISFKGGLGNSAIPYRLKSMLVSRSIAWGGVEWNIYGLGQGFNNNSENEISTFQVTMKGYNYIELAKQMNRLKEKLERNKRIQKVNTNERLNYGDKGSHEYIMNLDAKRLALHNTNNLEVLNKINELSAFESPSTRVTVMDRYYLVMLKEKESANFSTYELVHHAVQLDSNRHVRLGDLGNIVKTNTATSILKENRQYIRVAGFEYIGSAQFGDRYLQEVLIAMKQQIPIGYSIEQNSESRRTKNERYIFLLVLIITIYFICAILFENLLEPLFIISIIPISFIGIFLIFYLGGFYFDQGGYASFVLSGGLVSNAAIFIIQDFRSIRAKTTGAAHNWLLIKSTFNRARTILLTTVSTCCGLVPFCVEGQKEVFWFSLAIGTIGGLFFSLLALFIVLPVFLWQKNS